MRQNHNFNGTLVNWNIEIGEHKQTELSKNLIKRLEAIYL